MSSTGSQIATAAKDGAVQVWDSDSGQPVGHRLQLAPDEISSVGLSADGRQIICGTYDGEVRVWDVTTGQPITPASVGDKGDDRRRTDVVGVAFSPDRTRFVSAGAGDDTIREWDVRTAQLAAPEMTGHQDNVNAVAFSASGTYIVSGANDDTVRLWLAATGERVGQPLQAGQADVTSVAISADERVIASGGRDGSIRLWPGPAAWAENLCAKFTARINKQDWGDLVSSEIRYQPICPPE
jgi:WD40 repeat protein